MFQHLFEACTSETAFGCAIENPRSDAITLAKQTWGDASPPRREPGPSLVKRVDCLLAALPLLVDGHDDALARQIAVLGLARTGVILRRLRHGNRRRFNLIVVPDAVRQDAKHLAGLTRLRRRESRANRHLVLVGETTIDRQPRLANALLITECAGFLPSASGRLAVIALLAESGATELAALLPLLRRQVDPAASVLALVAAKALAVDLDRPLGPHSLVRLSPSAIQARH